MDFLKTRAFPTFFQDYAPKLIEFFGVWINWLNEEDNSAYIIDHLSSEHDIDESIKAFKTHIKNNIMADYPDSIESDLKLLLKNIFYLYNSKSSIKAYDFLFRCLFNSPAKISYPKDKILRASDGRWTTPKYMSVSGYDLFQNLESYNSYMIQGESSGATAYLNGGTVYVYTLDDGTYATRNSILLASVSKKFENGERLILKNAENNEIVNIENLYVEYYEEAQGVWEGTKGFLNSDMVIQDSHYYQDFSYIIQSNVSISKWRNIVKNLIHPAGLEFFGDLLLADDEYGDGTLQNMYVNPIDFLKYWHIVFKMYLFYIEANIQFYNFKRHINIVAQRHSETVDAWLYFGKYHEKNGYDKIIVQDINNFFNRSSVLLFRDNGTLIHPNIINWGLFEFIEDINTTYIHGITLNPNSHVLVGEINGNEWKPEFDESFITKNFMMFITNTSPNENTLIKSFVVDNTYLRYTEDTPEGEDYLIKNTYLSDTAKKFPNNYSKWNTLTTKDYIATSKEDIDTLYDEKSLLKIPDLTISTSENKYIIENKSYNNEKIVIYSYDKTDFTHRLYITRENNKVDIYYTNFRWYNIGNPKNPILDSNLKVIDKKYINSSDSFTDIYSCNSISYDENKNEIPLQQTQFTLELPYTITEDKVLLFINGLLSNNFKIKNNTIFIDAEEKNREIICYVQDNGSITADKEGKKFLYLLDDKEIFYNEDGVQYFVQENGFISKDYLGMDIQYTVSNYTEIFDTNNIVVFYKQNNNTITEDKEGNIIKYYIVNNTITYDKDGIKTAFYIQDNGNITIDKDGKDVLYYIQKYRIIKGVNNNQYLYWQENNIISNDIQGLDFLYNVKKYQLIIENKYVKYFIQDDKSISTDIFGKNIEYYLQPDNVITTNYILYDSSKIRFENCTLETILSKSETNSSKLEDIMLIDEIVIELDNSITKEFSEFDLNDIMYYIYGVEQTRMKSTVEMYILSPTNAMRQETTKYNHDKNFVYNSAVLSPYTVYDTNINHFHVVDIRDFYNIDIESNDWYIKWLKLLNSNTDYIKSNNILLNLPAQRHSETMNNIFYRDFIELYNIYALTENEILSKLNEFSLLVFDDNGYLINPFTIDWYNMNINSSSQFLYSVQLMPEEVFVYADSKPSNNNYFLFIDNKKIPDDERTLYLNKMVDSLFALNVDSTIYTSDLIKNYYITKYNNLGNLTVDDLINTTRNTRLLLGNGNCDTLLVYTDRVMVYNYHNQYISDYYKNGTETIIYLNHHKNENSITSLKFKDAYQNTVIQLNNNTFERIKNIKFSQLINNSNEKYLYVTTGNDDVSILNNNYYIDPKYILVFVDGLYNNTWKYVDGQVILKEPPKEYSEVYILNSYDYNSQDIIKKGINNIPFTFNNMRLNPYVNSCQTNLIDNNICISDTDLLFLNRQIDNYHILRQSIDSWNQYIRSTNDAYTNILLHFTHDRLLRDGTFDVYQYATSSIVDNDTIQGTPVDYLESKFNKLSTMMFNNNGNLINPNDINWSITSFKIPQNTNEITTVCLNSTRPAIISEVKKINFDSTLTSNANILLNVSQSKDISNVLDTLSVNDSVIQDPYTYDTELLSNIGNTDRLYYKKSKTSYENAIYVDEDEFISDNIFLFINGIKVYKDDIVIDTENKIYNILNFDDYISSKNIIDHLESLTENDLCLSVNNKFVCIGDIISDDIIYNINEYDELSNVSLNNNTSLSQVIKQNIESNECVIFQYNKDDLDAIIEQKNPTSKFFTLPSVGYNKNNILVFVNGLYTKKYYIEGNMIVFNENILNTVEIYVFKKYDYLHIDTNKYNNNYNNFIVKNIKRSLFF